MSLHDHLDQLRMLVDQSDTIRHRATNCADAFNGSEVASAIAGRDTAEREVGHTLNNQFAYYIMQLQNNLNALNSQISRIQDEVLQSSNGPAATRSADRL